MDYTLNRRLVILREHFAGKRGQRTFARMVGIKQQSISNYERGSMPSANVLAKLVLATGVSAEWLLTGRGPMFPDSHADTERGEAPGGLTYVDENALPMPAERLAEILEITEAQARAFLEAVGQSPAGRERLPVAVRTPKARMMLLYPSARSDELLKMGVTVEITEQEVQVTIPGVLMGDRTIRVIPAGG